MPAHRSVCICCLLFTWLAFIHCMHTHAWGNTGTYNYEGHHLEGSTSRLTRLKLQGLVECCIKKAGTCNLVSS